ncbi:coiled-coil domain-containing protein 63-like [Brachyistius frenatus]|uniref:coiled-coil domain-containing protein 63-like n=1 Tax=Brachyistius frenatus TaxID=100188 RepID=UPI0037E82FE0
MFMENKRTTFSLMNYITELSYRRNMLKNRTDKMKSDIMFLERKDEQSTNLMKDLELDLENSSRLADSLEEQVSVAQTTLDQLKVAISGLLDEIQENVTVTSDNMTHFICFLENIRNGIVEEQQELQLANFDLLPAIKCSNRNSAVKVSDSESSVEKERSKSSSAASS